MILFNLFSKEDLPNTPSTTVSTIDLDILDDPIRFIEFRKLRKYSSFPRYPENKSICTNLSDIDISQSFMVFLSHCWLRGSKTSKGFKKRPHPDSLKHEKFKLLLECIDKMWGSMAPGMKYCYVWIDFACINQDGDPAGELRQLDKIIQSSDCLLTVVVDNNWKDWNYETTVDGCIKDYKAESWRSYLSRAWCRVEMLYAAHVPFEDFQVGKRLENFRSGVRGAMELGRRAHFLYGTKDSVCDFFPSVLCPLQDSYLQTHSPLDGYLSYESDRSKIKMLMGDLNKYIKPQKYGYEGTFKFDYEVRHGQGKMVLPNGFIYDGVWEDDLPHGEGKIFWPNGNLYKGQLQHGHISGRGECFYSFGNYQSGVWRDGKLHGQGKMSYATGTGYIGEFTDGKITGFGMAHYTNFVPAYEGYWVNGVAVRPFSWSLPCYFCRAVGYICQNSCCYYCRPYDPIAAQEDINFLVARRYLVDWCCCGIFEYAKNRGGAGATASELPDIIDYINETI